MPLLETLPEEVENSLRDLREQSSSKSDTPALPGVVAVSEPYQAVAVVGDQAPVPVEETVEPESADETATAIQNAPFRLEDGQHITFETDINVRGEFGTEWLVADSSHLYVFAPNGGNRAKVLQAIPIGQIREVKSETQIGNGLLEARTRQETIPLVRFSQAVTAEANVMARQITALAKGEEYRQENVEATRKHCPRCKR